MKMDAIKHQGVDSAQVGQKRLCVEKVADDAGESRNQIKRYIRLTYLIPELLSMVDDGKIAFNPAVELSYIDSYQQRAVLDAMALNDCTPSHAQAIKMRRMSEAKTGDERLSKDAMAVIMEEEKGNQKEQFKIPKEKISRFFAPGTPTQKIEDTIVKALELYRKRQRSLER